MRSGTEEPCLSGPLVQISRQQQMDRTPTPRHSSNDADAPTTLCRILPFPVQRTAVRSQHLNYRIRTPVLVPVNPVIQERKEALQSSSFKQIDFRFRMNSPIPAKLAWLMHRQNYDYRGGYPGAHQADHLASGRTASIA